jgi:hypothetical protein
VTPAGWSAMAAILLRQRSALSPGPPPSMLNATTRGLCMGRNRRREHERGRVKSTPGVPSRLNWARLKEVVAAARALPAESRPAYLAEACAGNEVPRAGRNELRRRQTIPGTTANPRPANRVPVVNVSLLEPHRMAT